MFGSKIRQRENHTPEAVTDCRPAELLKEKVYLWFSTAMARKGCLFFVPVVGKTLVKCTAITRELKPPSTCSFYVTDTYLKII